MTYLPATVVGGWFYLYLILDLCSREIIRNALIYISNKLIDPLIFINDLGGI